MKNFTAFLKQMEDNAMLGLLPTRNQIIHLLEPDADSKEAILTGETAKRIAKNITGNKAGIWAAVGVDFVPCSVNCEFCSFGEKWQIIKKPYEWSQKEIIELAVYYLKKGAKWITLRTTEFYPAQKIIELVKKIRKVVAGNYHIVVNTGEFTDETAQDFKKIGIDTIYHSLRLREGIQSGITSEYRQNTLAAVEKSPLDLAFLVEPIGIEHSNEEIADIFITAIQYHSQLTGAMARVSVTGTPLGNLPALSQERLAQITAVTRICSGINIKDICSHPPTRLAVEYGANVLVVESGAVPRAAYNKEKEWNEFNIDDAIEYFIDAGYEIDYGIERK